MNQLIKSIWRFPLKKKMRSKLIINNVRIVSSNCIGGILYNELGLEFLSPTINLTIEPFGKFCSKLDYYLNYKTNDWVMSYDFKEGYPVAKIDEITIKGVHYDSEKEMKAAWKGRKDRFYESNYEIVLMASDTQLKTEEDRRLFCQLPYKKVCFTNRRDKLSGKEFVYIPGFEEKENVGDLTQFVDFFGNRVFEKYFDCVEWLNRDHANYF